MISMCKYWHSSYLIQTYRVVMVSARGKVFHSIDNGFSTITYMKPLWCCVFFFFIEMTTSFSLMDF